MTTPGPANTSSTARLILGELGFQVGWQERVILPAPAAGAQWAHVTDGRYFERILAMDITFTTSSVVANRYPVVDLVDNNGQVITEFPAGAGILASSTVLAHLAIDGPAYAFGTTGATYGYMPDILTPPGWAWQSSVGGMDAGDQFTRVALLVQRFPNDAAQISAVG